MNWDEKAAELAAKLRATGHGFLTLRRDELRAAFGLSRLTANAADEINNALVRNGLFTIPPPSESGSTLRIYDQNHPIGAVIDAVASPDKFPDTILRRIAISLEREHAGRELRSDDVPWIIAFDVFLQVVMGKEPEGWEELNDDRHPLMLARTLAETLGFDPSLVSEPSTVRIAAAVCAVRPRHWSWQLSDFSALGMDGMAARLLGSLEAVKQHLRESHVCILQQAACLLLKSEEIPVRRVELGLLGLRYRRENIARSKT